MLDQDKKPFEEAMIGLGELYSKEITKPLLRIYFSALADYSLTQVHEGMSKHTMDHKHGTFFPKPADIVRHLQKQTVSTEEKSELAWAQIKRQLRIEGSYGSLKLDDRQAMAALRSITSWKDLCAMPEDKLTWCKKEFMSMYSTFENTPLEMLPSDMPGLIELQHHKKEGAKSLAQLMGDLNERRNNKLTNN